MDELSAGRFKEEKKKLIMRKVLNDYNNMNRETQNHFRSNSAMDLKEKNTGPRKSIMKARKASVSDFSYMDNERLMAR